MWPVTSKLSVQGITHTMDYLASLMENITAHLPKERSHARILQPRQNRPTSKCFLHSYIVSFAGLIASKYLDAHLKPYTRKDPQCADAYFSANGGLFRHEREGHGMHGYDLFSLLRTIHPS